MKAPMLHEMMALTRLIKIPKKHIEKHQKRSDEVINIKAGSPIGNTFSPPFLGCID
jgi:hypothetical protein